MTVTKMGATTEELICELDFIFGNGSFKSECLGAYISKVLGTCILAGSFTLKLPQIFNIVSSKNVKGLSPAAFYTEVPVTLTAVMYNFLQENPFTSYGEMVIITVQNLILVLLLWTYMKPPASMGTIAAVLGAFIGIAVACLYTPSEWQFLIPFCGLPMVLYSRGIQVLVNYQEGTTGQLSLITTVLQLGGSVARIFTTIQEVGYDIPLLTGYALSASLTGTIFLQIMYYSYAAKKKAD